jgi:tetratricopeptide (TPR) repeat protein
MKWLFVILLTLFAQPVAAACPDLPDRSQERSGLLEQLKAADSYSKGAASIAGMWMFWRTAPDEVAQELLDNGVASIRISDLIRAEDVLTRLVKYCPDYAEGHNQLAFAYFLQGKYDRAQASLDRTLELEPAHFGALSGKALVYMRQGREDIAQVFLRRAVAINPWLNERSLLRPAPGGDDI